MASNETAYLSSQTLITPSSPGIIIAAFTSSLHPSNFDNRTGFFVELNLSLLDDVAGLISAAIFLSLGIRFGREIEITLLHTHNFPPKEINIPKCTPCYTLAVCIAFLLDQRKTNGVFEIDYRTVDGYTRTNV